jgi:predicted metal-dependent phosphoesterase TrpH
MKRDFHMHTFLSDGDPSPTELVRACIELGLDEISITDHDSIGSYPAVFDVAKGSKLKIVPGAELDCTLDHLEIHMLAFGLDVMNVDLNQHLASIQAARKKRASEQANAINAHYGREVINLSAIFARCQTFMNPHLIHAMLDQGMFDHEELPDRYKAAQSWMKTNIRVDTVITKPTAAQMIDLIHKANGVAVLAHPAYYWKNGDDLEKMVHELKEMGMDGIEVTYPYFQDNSREFPTINEEREAVTYIREFAKRYSLQESTGSDAHQLSQLRAFHTRG